MVEFDIPLYGGVIRVFSDQDEYQSMYQELTDDECDLTDHLGITHQLGQPDGSMIYLIGMFDNNITTLVHECTHVAVFICGYSGWDINEATSEPFAYLLEHIVKQSMSAITT